MGCYRVLSKPISLKVHPNYKGLYRSEPFPHSTISTRFMALWERYTQYLEPLRNMGITTELTIDELKDFASLATREDGDCYEVIYLSEIQDCPHSAKYYGIDVTGLGGYSIIGEGLFQNNIDKGRGLCVLFDILNHHFGAKLNSNGLFDTLGDAVSFRTVLKELEVIISGDIEQEDWRIINVYKLE